MGKAISLDLRQRVCAAVDEGLSCRQAAARFAVSVSSALRWKARQRATATLHPGPLGGDRRSGRVEAEAAFLLASVAAQPDITLGELQRKLSARGTTVGIATLWRFFDRRRITLKKRRRTRPSRTGPT